MATQDIAASRPINSNLKQHGGQGSSHKADESTSESDLNDEDCVNVKDDSADTFELGVIDQGPGRANATDMSDLGNGDELRGVRYQPRRRSKGFKSYTPDEERKVVKKLDQHLVLFLAMLYMLSFLDRSNIGNARIAGLTEDLNLSSSQYEWALTAFYITYILFEWMTLLFRVVPPHIYISLCVASWGLVASLQSIANSFSFLVILRSLLGISEAAFVGIPFYLSFFFRREELAYRTGLFISAAPLATSFASGLAWLIVKAGQDGPIAPWRLLFLVEGFPSIVVAFVAWYLIPDTPGTASFLSDREKRVAQSRVRDVRDHPEKSGLGRPKLRWAEIGQTFLDPKCYLTALMFFSCNVAFSSLPPFLPTIIKEMNYSPLASQLLSVPPYIFSFFIVLVTAYLSDRHAVRSPFVIFHALLGSLGYSIIALAGYLRADSRFRYAGVYFASAGFFSAVTLIIAWTINNQASAERRGTGVAILNVIGQCGPLIGTRLYPDSDKPYYVRGMSICAEFMFIVAALALGLRLVLKSENEGVLARAVYERVEMDDNEDGNVSELEADKDLGRSNSEHQEFMNML